MGAVVDGANAYRGGGGEDLNQEVMLFSAKARRAPGRKFFFSACSSNTAVPPQSMLKGMSLPAPVPTPADASASSAMYKMEFESMVQPTANQELSESTSNNNINVNNNNNK